jgi:Zinc finger, C3HC4 type (RING finger)
MVCFEEFQPDERYPVVLPCGHTYVCNICANRLDKCMECRTPLYTLVSVPNGINTQRATWTNRTVRHQYEQQSPPPQPPLKKRVALPKNVVLLSLIEATELASEDARKKFEDETPEGESSATDYPGTPTIPVLQSMASMLDAAEDEEERIKVSTSIAVGVAGTYAVAAKGGLEIFPTRPVGGDVITTAVDARDEDVDSLVKFYNIESLEDGGGTPNSRRSKDYLKLCFGDRVQIVTFDGGWAKLARGYGYVKADSNQLVKGMLGSSQLLHFFI